jgi:hypothetical protein
VSQQGMKPAGRDQGFSIEGFPFISISVLFIVFIFIVDIVVLLLLLLLSRCTLSCLAIRYH